MENPVYFKLGVLILFVTVFCNGDDMEKESKDPMAKAFDSLNPEEKTDFVSYFLALSLRDWAESQPRPPKFLTFQKPDTFIKDLDIPIERMDRFEKMNIPKESRIKLLQWTKSEFNLTTRNVVELLRNKKGSTFPRLPDIGELCCPW